jgi:tripartite ATP-independent transporter DctM subunit
MIEYVGLLVILIALITCGMPVGFASGIVTYLGAAIYFGDLFDPRAATMIARLAIDKMDDFLLLSIPFFILAGRLMNTGGITERLFSFVAVATRPLPGGHAHANVLASLFFAGMSGSATADALSLGRIEMRAMLAHGYKREFAAGITAASSLLSPVIPPSIALVAYAVQAEVSVAAMFFAAIVPGLLMTAGFMAYVAWQAWRQDFPAGAVAGPRELWAAFRPAALSMLTPVIIIGGIYLGVFTPTEAAAVAAAYAMLLGGLYYREFGARRLLEEIRGTMIDSAVVMLIVAFTSALGVVLIRAELPTELAEALAGLTQDPYVLMILMVILWAIVGCFMAQTPAILVLAPILVPIAQSYGIDLVYFGVVMTIALTVGLLTPPVGMVLYAMVRVAELPFPTLVRISTPYVILTFGIVFVLVALPELSLFLPRLLM